MRAFAIQTPGSFDALTLVDRQDPRPGPGQVRLRVRAVSLNYRDLVLARGGYGRSVRFPLVPCSDAAGEIDETGPGVTRVRTGDRVAGCFMPRWIAGRITDEASRSALGGALGGVLAEAVILDEEAVVALPTHLTFEEASTLPCAAVTAWHALVTEGRVAAGDSVLVLGTGGVSIFALQFAVLAGVRVIVTSKRDAKLERASRLGAWQGVNYVTIPEWDRRVRDLTDGAGVDHVVEVGGAGTLGRSLRAVRTGGRISLIGVVAGQGDVDVRPILLRNICVQGIYVGSRDMFDAMNRAIQAHGVRPVVDRVFPFHEAPAAFAYLESGSHFGKVVIALD